MKRRSKRFICKNTAHIECEVSNRGIVAVAGARTLALPERRVEGLNRRFWRTGLASVFRSKPLPGSSSSSREGRFRKRATVPRTRSIVETAGRDQILNKQKILDFNETVLTGFLAPERGKR